LETWTEIRSGETSSSIVLFHDHAFHETVDDGVRLRFGGERPVHPVQLGAELADLRVRRPERGRAAGMERRRDVDQAGDRREDPPARIEEEERERAEERHDHDHELEGARPLALHAGRREEGLRRRMRHGQQVDGCGHRCELGLGEVGRPRRRREHRSAGG
jgi:hypothetical protein